MINRLQLLRTWGSLIRSTMEHTSRLNVSHSSTPSTGKIAIKVINHYGDEVLKVYEVQERLLNSGGSDEKA